MLGDILFDNIACNSENVGCLEVLCSGGLCAFCWCLFKFGSGFFTILGKSRGGRQLSPAVESSCCLGLYLFCLKSYRSKVSIKLILL